MWQSPRGVRAKVLNGYDLALARRVLVAGLLLGASAFAVAAATDEADASTADRLARLAALLPVLGALAASLVVAQARSRGELRALHAMGVEPARAVRGAWLGAVLVGLMGVALVGSKAADIGSLFPRIDGPTAWVFVDERWMDASTGLLVHSSGDVELGAAPLRAPAGPSLLEPATLLTLALASFAVPAWALASCSATRRFVVALGASLAAVTLFHLVAAGRLSPFALTAIPLSLLGDLCLRGTRVSAGA